MVIQWVYMGRQREDPKIKLFFQNWHIYIYLYKEISDPIVISCDPCSDVTVIYWDRQKTGQNWFIINGNSGIWKWRYWTLICVCAGLVLKLSCISMLVTHVSAVKTCWLCFCLFLDVGIFVRHCFWTSISCSGYLWLIICIDMILNVKLNSCVEVRLMCQHVMRCQHCLFIFCRCIIRVSLVETYSTLPFVVDWIGNSSH